MSKSELKRLCIQDPMRMANELSKLKEELAAAHQAGYNQCLKELSEREPLYFADIYLHCLAGRSLILRPTYPKE